VIFRPALSLLVLAALAVGVAGAQSRATFAKDPRGDADGGPLDIVRVAISRTSDGKLRGEVTMAGSWTAADLRPGGSVCLRVYAKRVPDADIPDHLVCAVPAAEGDALSARVLRDRANGLPIPSGAAAVSRPTARTVYLRFAQSSVAMPAEMMVSAEAVTRGPACRAPLGCRDLTPDSPGAMELRLRSTADH
jgi:hypothetical protein